MTTPREFLTFLEVNEINLGDGAAMLLTCEQLGLTLEQGHDMLFSLMDEEFVG